MHRLDLGLYSHPKEFWGNGVRNIVNSRRKIPSTGNILLRGGWNPRRCVKQDSEPNTLPTSCPAPRSDHNISCLALACCGSLLTTLVSAKSVCLSKPNIVMCHAQRQLSLSNRIFFVYCLGAVNLGPDTIRDIHFRSCYFVVDFIIDDKVIIIMMIMSGFLKCLSMWNMLNCAEQV